MIKNIILKGIWVCLKMGIPPIYEHLNVENGDKSKALVVAYCQTRPNDRNPQHTLEILYQWRFY
jgi:hypothetical protein